MNEATLREKIRAYIVTTLMREPDYELADNEGIITDSLIDSLDLAELGVFIEQEFDVYIPDPDLTVEKMDTLNLIVARVQHDLD
ncbi:MAG: hypothetical protein Phog2KO_00060 [Phototrophicaceae bacterium]